MRKMRTRAIVPRLRDTRIASRARPVEVLIYRRMFVDRRNCTYDPIDEKAPVNTGGRDPVRRQRIHHPKRRDSLDACFAVSGVEHV
jgi:hypothetical protein